MFQIIDSFANTNNEFEATFQHLVQVIHNKECDENLIQKIDAAVMEGHEDHSVFSLFISVSIEYMCYFNQFEKAYALRSIGQNLHYEKIHPRIKAFFCVSCSRLSRSEGNVTESMEWMEKALALVPHTDDRYLLFLGHSSILLAAQGILKTNGAYNLDRLQDIKSGIEQFGAIEAKIVNCIHIAEPEEGLKLLKEYRAKTKEKIPNRFLIYENLLNIISGDFNSNNYNEEPYQLFANILGAISNNKIADAIKNYHLFLKTDWPKLQMQQWANLLPIHFELCLGNKGMAIHILQEKIKKGDKHYLDDLFFGRICLLENNLEAAKKSFIKLHENMKKYGALNRLQFELQLAKEMKLEDILSVLRGTLSITKSRTTEKFSAELASEKVTVEDKVVMVGNSQKINLVKNLIERYSKLKTVVLISGETGTGKELVARALHEQGFNKNEPFLAVNCGALTDSLLQSELFGYVKGAFTGAQNEHKGVFECAGEGTVFLDEFGNISPKLQVSLLRIFESNEIQKIGENKTHKINCRIIVATNVDLKQAVKRKEFREDLYYRLSRFEIYTPPLRERKEDILEIAQYFLSLNSKDQNTQKSFSQNLKTELNQYSWPGNIRQLKNEIEKMCVLNPNTNILDTVHFELSDVIETSEPQESAISVAAKPNKIDIFKLGFPIEHRQTQLKELFQIHKKLTKSQVVALTEVSPSTAAKDLSKLEKTGFIIKRTPTKSTRTDYFELNNP